MNKTDLKKVFITAKAEYARFIGVVIATEGNDAPEIIINPEENFSAKYDYYMDAYDDDLILIAAKGKKDIRIVGAAFGNNFEDIQRILLPDAPDEWKLQISAALDRVFDRMMKDTPPQTEEERVHVETLKEAYKGMFIKENRTAAEADFVKDNIDEYEKAFEICMNGDEMEFKKMLVDLQRRQNEYVLHRNDRK